jgi:Family of unknown function (DUF5343)
MASVSGTVFGTGAMLAFKYCGRLQMASSTNTENGSKWSPPYTSFQTLMNTINRMAEQGGVPSRIDRSYLSNMPGSVRATFLGSLRSLELIDDDAKPTSRLISLVDAHEDEDRKQELVTDMLKSYYAAALNLPPNATQAQLESVFREYGVSGSTLRKAIAFFLAAARFADLTLSPHFRLPRDPSTGERRPAPARRSTPTAAQRGGASPTWPQPSAAGHPLIAGLIRELPPPGEAFPASRQEAWFAIAKATFQLIYKTGADEARQPASPSDRGGSD